jgi:hypothetical protein
MRIAYSGGGDIRSAERFLQRRACCGSLVDPPHQNDVQKVARGRIQEVHLSKDAAISPFYDVVGNTPSYVWKGDFPA